MKEESDSTEDDRDVQAGGTEDVEMGEVADVVGSLDA